MTITSTVDPVVEERAAFLLPWVKIAATYTDPQEREAYLRSGLVTRQILEAPYLTDEARADLLNTATALPAAARQELAAWLCRLCDQPAEADGLCAGHREDLDNRPVYLIDAHADTLRFKDAEPPVVVFVMSDGGEYFVAPAMVGIMLNQLHVPVWSPLRPLVYGIAELLHGSAW